LIPKPYHARFFTFEKTERIYIIPTKIGLYFTFIGFVLFLIAISYGHNLAYFATFLFVGFVGLCAIVTNENIRHVTFELPHETVRVRQGVNSFVDIYPKNIGQSGRFDLDFEIHGVSVLHVEELSNKQSERHFLNLNRLQLERGIYRSKRIVISSTFPFGLFYAWKIVAKPLRLIVAPKPQKNFLHETFHGPHGEGQGASAHLAGVSEFHEIREHRERESLRRLDQRKTQQYSRPFVRDYRDEASQSRILDLRTGSDEVALAQALSWLDYLPDEVACGLIFPDGHHSGVDIGALHRIELFDQIACYQRSLKVLL